MGDPQTISRGATVELVTGPIRESEPQPMSGSGAVLTFRGVVRPTEAGRRLKGLDYTSYDPMAERQLRRIGDQAIQEHGLLSVRMVHSRGFVGVGEASLLLTVYSEHRKPALHAMDGILDQLKRDVPIWKTPVYAEPEGSGA